MRKVGEVGVKEEQVPIDDIIQVPVKFVELAVDSLRNTMNKIRCRDCEHYSDGVCESWAQLTDPHGWCYRARKKGE